MFRNKILWRAAFLIWLALTGTGILYATTFQPAVTMLGVRSQTDETIEWVVTVSNAGDSAGENILITNTVGDGLAIDSVSINTGTTSIDGRTITIAIPTIAPDETIQFSIVTTILNTSGMNNVACVRADNLAEEYCVRGLPVQALPATGEAPVWWRQPLLWIGVLIVSVSLLTTGIGMLGLQIAQDDRTRL